PRSLALGRPTPVGKNKAGASSRRPRPLAYRRPPGARVALLRSPILPTAQRSIAASHRAVQPRIIRGGSRSDGRSDKGLTPDILIVAKMRTFLLLPDRPTKWSLRAKRCVCYR